MTWDGQLSNQLPWFPFPCQYENANKTHLVSDSEGPPLYITNIPGTLADIFGFTLAVTRYM